MREISRGEKNRASPEGSHGWEVDELWMLQERGGKGGGGRGG